MSRMQAVPELLEVLQRHLLHLVGRVAALERRPEAEALDRLDQDDRRLALVLGGRVVGRVHLPVVVAAAAQAPDLVVGHVRDHLLGPRVAPEEVLADVGAVVGPVGLVVAVGRGVHQVDQRAVPVAAAAAGPTPGPRSTLITFQPAPRKNDSSSWMILPLPRTGPSSRCRLQLMTKVRLSRPSMAATWIRPRDSTSSSSPSPRNAQTCWSGGVLDAAVVQVPVDPGLLDGVHRAQAHRHGRELPEVRHQPRVRVGRDAAARVGDLSCRKPSRSCSDNRPSRKALAYMPGEAWPWKKTWSPPPGWLLAAEEMVEADLVQAGRGRVGRDVPAHPDSRVAGPGAP